MGMRDEENGRDGLGDYIMIVSEEITGVTYDPDFESLLCLFHNQSS